MNHYSIYNTKERIEALARQWLDDKRARRDLSEAMEDVMIITFLGGLQQNIELMTAVLRESNDDSDLMAIATSIGEKMMSKHGQEAIDWFVDNIESNPKFKTMARYLWRADIHDDVWARIQSAVDVSAK